MRLKLLFFSVLLVALAIGGYLLTRESAIEKFAKSTKAAVGPTPPISSSSSSNTKAQLCPPVRSLVKTGLGWSTSDQKWEFNGSSSATKVLNFIGAQWIGVKVGKIICLYQTDEEVKFPLALEQKIASLIPEPTGGGWSALINHNHKLCKSLSIADCPYVVELPSKVEDIYQEIKYLPNREKY